MHAFRLADGTLHELWLSRTPQGYELHRGAQRTPVALHARGPHLHELVVGDDAMPVFIAVQGDELHLHLDGQAHVLRYTHALERHAGAAQDRSDAVARAPMPGVVVALHVQPGQAVQRGDTLLVIESMKMETTLRAGTDGTVHTVHVAAEQSFERDAVLVTITPTEGGDEAAP
ncbi:MAG: DUF2118 domain-containing protein [Rubrivivax sp.]